MPKNTLDYIRRHGHHLHHQKYHRHLQSLKPHQFQQEIYLNLHPEHKTVENIVNREKPDKATTRTTINWEKLIKLS